MFLSFPSWERRRRHFLLFFYTEAFPRPAARVTPPPSHNEGAGPLRDLPANGVDVAESLVVEVVQRLRLENRHVDVAVPEDVLQGFLLSVVRVRVPVPHVFLRAQGFRVVIEAIDPTFREVGPQPIFLRRVPNVEVVVDNEQVLFLSIRRLGSDHEESPLTLGRMNGLARLKPILADGGPRSRSPRADGGIGRPTPRVRREPQSKKRYLALAHPSQGGREEIEWIRRRVKQTRRRGMKRPGGFGQPVGARGTWSRSSSSAGSSQWSWPSSFLSLPTPRSLSASSS